MRNMARSYRYQTLYTRSKELGLKLFDNDRDFSKIQMVFLGWLNVYDFLKAQIQMDKPHLSEEILENNTLTDAWLYWWSKKGNKQQHNTNTTIAHKKEDPILADMHKVTFVNRKYSQEQNKNE